MLIDNSQAEKLYNDSDFKDYYWVTKAGYVYKVTGIDDNLKVKKMSPFTTRDGYIEYVLTTNKGTKKHVQAQILVLKAFKGKPKGKGIWQVNHKDTVRSNNKLGNLEWMTPSQNIKHSFTKGKKIHNLGKKRQSDGSYA